MKNPFILSALLATPVLAQLPAIPGAEGYGAYAKGGRGGDVYIVTNLNSSGSGSLAEGLASAPTAGRTIVFAVSGYIHVPGSNLRLTNNKITIAGQTAPGGGIGLKDGTFRISGDDVVVRHVRFRHGKNGGGGDCVNLDSGSINSMLDHISMTFSTDENFSSFNSPPENLTLQWSLNSWGLESHSAGGLWDQNHATCHHTLWAHNHTRNPKARPNGLLEWTNNVTYDWDIGFIMGDSQTPAPWKANVTNNYFICPPGNIRNTPLEKASLDRNGFPNFSVHVSGNLHDRDGDGTLNGTDRGYDIVRGTAYNASTNPTGNYIRSNTPFANTGSLSVSADPALLAYKKLVSNSGPLRLDASSSLPIRDEVDTRMIQNLVTRTRNHITRESDLAGVSNGGFGTLTSAAAPTDTDKDGMPDIYETALGWNPAVQDHNTVVTGTSFLPTGTAAGYTRLEEYLHFLAIPHATVAKSIPGGATSLTVDLRKFTSGFSVSPTFTVSEIVGGTVTLSGTGNAIALFTPTQNFSGRARFDFTVTDADLSTWKQDFAILVANAGIPRDLTWKGDGVTNTWDGSALNWLRDTAPVAFSAGDRVTLDDTGSRTPAVNITGVQSPSSVTLSTAQTYTLGGSGSIAATGTLTKRGPGTLAIANTQNYSGGIFLEEGTIAATGALGVTDGSLTMSGGTVFQNAQASGNTLSVPAPFEIPSGNSATIRSGNRVSFSGAFTGSGRLDFLVETNVSRFDIKGPMSGLGGSVNFSGSGIGGQGVRLFYVGGNFDGFTNSLVTLSDTVSLQPQTNSGGNTLAIGALASPSANSNLAGGTAGTVDYVIGAKNITTTFAGSITGNATLTKTGNASLILAGTNNYTGATSVTSGTLRIDGTLGNSALTVSGNATLAGNGSTGGPVAFQTGAKFDPGTFTAAGGLSATSTNFVFDLSDSLTGANDIVSVTGHSAYIAGANTFDIRFKDGVLAAGNYKLIDCAPGIPLNVAGGMAMNLSADIPEQTRQSFVLNRTASGTQGGYIRLVVTGTPANLIWTGNNSSTWDLGTSSNFLNNGASDVFKNLDTASFDDSATNRTVDLTGELISRITTVNTGLGYTLNGPGGLSGNGTFVKSGTGTLTLNNTNTHTGGVSLNGGTIFLGTETAMETGLGTGPVTLGNGTLLSMREDTSTFNSFFGNLVVPTASTARINADTRVDMYGTLTGAGDLNLYIPFTRTTFFGDWSGFTGTINVLTDNDGGDFRMGTNYNYPGLPQAGVNLTDRATASFTGILAEGAGTTIPIGAISGTSLSRLSGGVTGGRALTYRIGGKNTDATFAGTIAEQNTGTATNYVKTGSGKWTLSGTGSWNGGTVVEAGTLEISGNIACVAATEVRPAATLLLSGNTLTSESVNILQGASFSARGTLVTDLTSSGTLETTGALAIQGNAFFKDSSTLRIRAATDSVSITNDLSLAGVLEPVLPPGTVFGKFPLVTYDGDLSGSIALSPIPNGHLSNTTPGILILYIDDSEEDGMPDTWEQSKFGSLAQTPDGDFDNDGTSNITELRLGTDPSNGGSAFRATISGRTLTWPSDVGLVFKVLRSTTLKEGEWDTVATVPGTAGTASYTDPESLPKAFYRIELE